MKIALVVLLLVLVFAAGVALYGPLVMNPGVLRELREEPHGARARKVMLISLPSGKAIPVNYLREDPFVFAAADFPWWRELRGEGGRVELLVRGERLTGHARAVEDDPARRASVFERLRPNALPWLGTLVEIRLDPIDD